ncbi:50S ribosomal protein L17 [Candidatus Saccharibacteria bacterium]|nr:MAG: 50S ribosomal protein L17 [Candidatus Saccharibacteria bacterium]PID99337.1 MAG: 50S ribosomal protein L17 [Candidatus Saccharibacteria bacterium]
MHRHGYQGTKFGRERDQREALLKSLAEALIIHGAIVTTLPKAKAVVPYVEKLITKAKKGDLHNRRQIIAALQTVHAAHHLVDEIAPKLGNRNSGHLRVVRQDNRRGDNAAMARVSFVDDLQVAPVAQPAAQKTAAKQHHDEASQAQGAHVSAKPKAANAKATDRHLSHKPAVQVRKSGER